MTGAKHLRIFLSYGHDSNEELVLRIHADLKKRGHDVWIDKKEIRPGDDWRREITEGILNSHQVLSFLSKHSTRDPGVCRDEIAIAVGVKGGCIKTILVESEAEVQPPVNISHVQWLDMHDWRDGHGVVHLVKDEPAVGDVTWEQWYETRLSEIVRVVESEESVRFAGEIETLNGYLKPIHSEARICQLLTRGFHGRQWLFETVESWRQDKKRNSRLFWIMGAPGVGKSALAAQLTHTRGDTVIAAQFCEWDKPDHRNAARVVRSLAFQLATRLPDYRKLLLTLPEIAELDRKDAAELFDYVLANPLKSVIDGGRERYLIVIDGLDEAGEAGRNPLVEMLARNAQRLPDWLGLVVTSRPEFDVKSPLQALNPFPLDTRSESNRADIRDYLRRELATQLQNRPDADRLVEQILEKSEGVFFYVERFCDDVHQGNLSLDRPEEFPQGLGGIYFQWFRRQFPDLVEYENMIEPALGAILAAREPLPVEILLKSLGWRGTVLRKWLHKLGSLFPVTKQANDEIIKPYHKSIGDWLADEAKAGSYFVSVIEGHRSLAESFLQATQSLAVQPHDPAETIPLYFREYGLDHLALCKRFLSELNDNEIAEIAYVTAFRKYAPPVGGLVDFSPAFVSACIKQGRFDQIALLVDGLAEAVWRFYLDSGLIRVGQDASGRTQRIITGEAKEDSSLRRALAATEHAIWIADQLLSCIGDCKDFRNVAEKMSGMRYMAGGLDVACWASNLSRYFDDAGAAAYRMICHLQQGKRAMSRE